MSSTATSATSALIERRREQMFPVLSPKQIEIARRFGGQPQRFRPNQVVFHVGHPSPAYLVLSGSLAVTRHDALGLLSTIHTHGMGELTGEINQLAGAPALAEGRAGAQGTDAMPFTSAQVQDLVVGTAEIGETIMRAFILRRVFLIETGAGVVLLGAGDTPEALRLQNFLRRNAVPFTLPDPQSDSEAAHLIERLGIAETELPLAISPDGTMLRNPNEKALAKSLGLFPSGLADRAYDVAIVGAGPAGLATAVYAGSEGLSVLVLDSNAIGGQAGASARIENYLGFPTGISGEALAGRAFTQAQKFGAITAIPATVNQLRLAADGERANDHAFELEINDDRPVRASSIVVASGARYRRLDLPNLEDFEGRGIYYWASPIELKLCARREVVVAGVRAGSVKRVSAAVGEGAAVVAQLHTYLRDAHPGKE